MASGHNIRRHQRPREVELEIRECAAIIMAAYAVGAEPNLDKHRLSIRKSAYRLLVFEGLIARAVGYQLTHRGTKHMERHGAVVYPNAYMNGAACNRVVSEREQASPQPDHRESK